MQVKLLDIDKSFGSNQVLKKASFELNSGEIHALMGENGAGKSTLMKILTGLYTCDNGKIYVDDQIVNYSHPNEAEKAGIVFIHQELNVIPDLTVEENMFLCKEITTKFGIVHKNKMKKEAQEILNKLGVDINPSDKLSDLSVGKQQMVEIAKALMVDAKVLIMDEPTAALTIAETEILFNVIRDLKSKGVSIVYISHRMEEIFSLCDRITILRDGQYVAVKEIANSTMQDIVKLMIGREIGDRFPKDNNITNEVALEVKSLNKGKIIKNVSFKVNKGEILGVSGLMGAGRTEIMQAIFGMQALDNGEIYIEGESVSINNPLQAKQLGIGFITEDRKVEGLLLEYSIRENISLPNLKNISNKYGVINFKKEKELSNQGSDNFKIRSSGIEQSTGGLSGGNQQKVVFAKWVASNPRILILDEPTRGVDIGAKKEIYNIMNELTKAGVAIIMVSSELPEIIGMSDRVAVIHEGKLAGIINRENITEENIMTLATGGSL
ncbi:D-xylose ABC transporter ATP-binding protein [Candidatus Epulonipiscium fishelsonii]|uniref:D-xylose ABC transporter ATP-binding protein n=1 Tax=Candidatus Epulonipiscium fishelsonii TaxID=77094 RepID=A0ACC8XBH1_9FIRM|nr:D-xylose ABC transporter ATP-binding protein [Epulopiscium sp. SCG-B11WGA-EpuloA1]ONI43448.1 D-xylose ABC transporter ATP-binding protein [Epulopiscium sp. SCG-B05WGA-EpuloA1]